MERKNYDLIILQAMASNASPTGAITLSEQLSIPQANIGRALIRLEESGLVAKSPRKGRIITPAGRSYLNTVQSTNQKLSLAQELISTAISPDESNLIEILEVRRLLEGRAARLAALHASEEDIRSLFDLQADYIYELRHGRSGCEEDLRLHLRIAELSHNSVIHKILAMILTEKRAYQEFTNAAVRANLLKQQEHIRILEAIREHKEDIAEEEMIKHLSRVEQNLKNSTSNEE